MDGRGRCNSSAEMDGNVGSTQLKAIKNRFFRIATYNYSADRIKISWYIALSLEQVHGLNSID